MMIGSHVTFGDDGTVGNLSNTDRGRRKSRIRLSRIENLFKHDGAGYRLCGTANDYPVAACIFTVKPENSRGEAPLATGLFSADNHVTSDDLQIIRPGQFQGNRLAKSGCLRIFRKFS